MDTRTLNTAVTVLERVIKPSIARAVLFTTYDCNQKCKTCNVWSINRERPVLHDKEMTLHEVQRFAKANPNLIWAQVTGGEPFMKKDLKHMLLALSGIPKLRMLSITCNGSLTDKMEEDLKYLLLNNKNRNLTVSVQISFHGPVSMQGAFTGVEQSYCRARESYKMLTSLTSRYPELEAKITYLFSKFNQGSFRPFLESFGEDLPSYGSILTGIAASDTFYNFKDRVEVSPERQALLEELKWLRSKYTLKERLSPESLISSFSSQDITKNTRKWGCVGMQFSCTIDPYWNIHPCLYNYDKTVGNLMNYNFSITKLTSETEKTWKPVVTDCYKEGCRSDCEARTALLFRPWKLFS